MIDDDVINEFYKKNGYNTNICNNFYYDETNNFRKFKFKENGLNIDNFLQKYRLGGITLDKNIDSYSLYMKMYDELNIQGELKFKQINTGKTNTFINCLKGKNLRKILEFVNNNEIYIHSFSFDNLYDIIIEIVDSLLEQFSDIYYTIAPLMKNDLYSFVSNDVYNFINTLKQYNYPNITGENVKLFCEAMIKWIDSCNYTIPFGLEICKQLFKVYFKNGELLFLKGNEEKTIIEGYYGINFDMCVKFNKSFHYFDELPEIEKELKKYKVNNYAFINSKNSIQIQLSDAIVGLLNRFFEFLDNNTLENIIKDLNNMSIFQIDNLILFLKIYKKSIDKNEMFFNFYEPINVVMRRNEMIYQLIEMFIKNSENINY